jgi:hypothetical protein
MTTRSKWLYWGLCVALLAVIVLMALAGCGETQKISRAPENPATTAADPVATSCEDFGTCPTTPPAPPADKVDNLPFGSAISVSDDDGKVAVEVVSSRLVPGDTFSQAAMGREWRAFVVSYDCLSGKCDFNPFDWTARGPDGTVLEQAILANPNDDLNSGTLNANGRVKGSVSFEMPIGTHGTVIYTTFNAGEASWRF